MEFTAPGNATLGDWLRDRRKVLGLTRKELARSLGYSTETIAKIESGERTPSRQFVEALASYLEIPAEARHTFLRFALGLPPEVTKGERSDPAATAQTGRVPHNLPAWPNLFIGRRREIAKTLELLDRQGVRLLTITGAPGIGKTRLALEVAGRALDHFEHGVFYVSLAPLRDPELVDDAIASALDLPTRAAKSPLDSLRDYARGKRLLLVLDNFEHLLPASSIVAELLQAARDLKIVVTSRALLRLYGEHEFRVPPLSVPGNRPATRERMGQYEAVQLFVERARAADPDFEITSANALAVVQLCRRLDGLPLAIELAAVRIRSFSPEAMISMLEDAGSSLPLLRRGDLNASARHLSLWSAISWSYRLLSDVERRAFQRLSAFVGGCTVEAAQAVALSPFGGPTAPGEDAMPAKWERDDTLESLADKGLLQRQAAQDGESRYSMLVTLREYAQTKLQESGEAETVRNRHASFFTHLAQAAGPRLVGPDQARWLKRLEADFDNIRAAFYWAKESGQTEMGLRLAGALLEFWMRCNHHLREAIDWWQALLAMGADAASADQAPDRMPALRAEVLLGLGMLSLGYGDLALSRSAFEQGRDIAQRTGDKTQLAQALRGLGDVAHKQSSLAESRRLYMESLSLLQETSAHRQVAYTMLRLAYLSFREGDYAEARAYCEQALALSREVGDLGMTGEALRFLASLALQEGDHPAAHALYQESLSITRQVGDRGRVINVLNGLGEVERAQGNFEAARILYEEVLAWYRELGHRLGVTITLHNLGHTMHRLGECEAAERMFKEGLRVAYDLGDTKRASLCLAGLGGVTGTRGDAQRAARLLGAAEAGLESAGARLYTTDLAEYERNMATVRGLLDEQAFNAAWEAGRALSVEQATAYALESEAS